MLKLTVLVFVLFAQTMAIDIKHKLLVHENDNLIKITYVSPCNDLRDIIQDSTKKYATDYMECEYNYKHSKYVIQQCQNHYNKNWIEALKSLTQCQFLKRNKRGITDIVTSPKVLKTVTNLLKTILSKDKEDASTQINNEFKITNYYNGNIMRDTFVNSNNAISHDVEARQSNLVPPDVWAANFVHKNIAQKSALVRIIANVCDQSKQLATGALAELLDNNELLHISQNNTRLTNVAVDFTNSTIILVYDLIKEITNQDDFPEQPISSPHNQFIILEILLLLIIILLISITIAIIFRIKENNPITIRTNADSVNEQSV